VAVVTGAGRGLGRCAALGLARQGAAVAAVARSESQIRTTVDEIVAEGGVALPLAADVGSIEAVDDLRRLVAAKLGQVGILVNAAGVYGPIEMIQHSDPCRWIETLLINTIGPYLTCRAFVGDMIAAGWGRIINFSSAASLHPPGPLVSAYSTSKAALNRFTRHLAAEVDGTGVTANVIHPGEVKTAMWAAICDESAQAGPQGAAIRDWAKEVGESGGDDPEKAVELVLKLVLDPSCNVSGRFLWIEGGAQQPITSW
jgi:NAD(P)-dependent dehydrogenase (short-subunit alcohol dehydrogenase family)